MNALINYAYLVPLFPFAGFLIAGFGKNKLKGNTAGIIGSVSVMIAFVFSLILFVLYRTGQSEPSTIILTDWISVGNLYVPFEFLIDPLSLLMMMLVTGVGFLIHVYSIGYMKGDDRFNSFFAQMNLFTACMLILVMSANYIMMFIGWEGVGLCSYLLIGFWYKKDAFSNAARKAFIMNRIGDMGFIIAAILIFHVYGSFSFQYVFSDGNALVPGGAMITAITLLLFLGAAGKSAQIPLYTWLPDAMAGPTPVSALIHAATMVTAGVYLVVRSNSLFLLAPITQNIIIFIGVITALIAALIALLQTDIKKILAYSTISQLGYMFVAAGMGAFSASMFHLTTHAFFKALLFLGAGSVIHSMKGEQDIKNMGGLRKKLPLTWLTFTFAVLAISGMPPFSGFFSKDLILAAAWEYNPGLWMVMAGIAFLTCFYMFRLLWLVFYGRGNRGTIGGSDIHESPKVMTLPLIILAVLSLLGGFINIPELFGGSSALSAFIGTPPDSVPVIGITGEYLLIGAAIAIMILAAVFSWWKYIRKARVPSGEEYSMGFFSRLVWNRFYIDEIYDTLLVKPYGFISQNIFVKSDNWLFRGIADRMGKFALWTGSILNAVQNGSLSLYIFLMVVGLIILILFNVY